MKLTSLVSLRGPFEALTGKFGGGVVDIDGDGWKVVGCGRLQTTRRKIAKARDLLSLYAFDGTTTFLCGRQYLYYLLVKLYLFLQYTG